MPIARKSLKSRLRLTQRHFEKVNRMLPMSLSPGGEKYNYVLLCDSFVKPWVHRMNVANVI
jgi:hypothetical protein